MRLRSLSAFAPLHHRLNLEAVTALLLSLLVGTALAILPLQLAVALVLGTLTALLTVVRLEYGLYLLAFSVPFGSHWEIALGPFSVSATEGLVALLLLAWAARMLAQQEAPVSLSPLFLPLVLFLAVLVLSASLSSSLSLSLKEVLKGFEVLAVLLMVGNSLEGERQWRLLLGCLIAAGVGQALLGWYQFLTQSGPSGFLLGGILRPYGSFGQPNPYGGYLGLTLALALGVLMGSWGRRQSLAWGLLAALASLTMLSALILTLSRGAWLGFAGAVVVMAALRSRRALFILGVAVLVVALVSLAAGLDLLPPVIAERLTVLTGPLNFFDARQAEVTGKNFALVQRMAIWQAAWEMFQARPLLGWGTGNFDVVYPQYALPGWEQLPGHAHNYYLNLLAEAGVPGLTTYLLFLLVAFAHSWRLLQQAQPASGGGLITRYGVTLGVIGMLVVLSLQNLVDNLFVHGMPALVGLALGLLVASPPGASMGPPWPPVGKGGD